MANQWRTGGGQVADRWQTVVGPLVDCWQTGEDNFRPVADRWRTRWRTGGGPVADWRRTGGGPTADRWRTNGGPVEDRWQTVGGLLLDRLYPLQVHSLWITSRQTEPHNLYPPSLLSEDMNGGLMVPKAIRF